MKNLIVTELVCGAGIVLVVIWLSRNELVYRERSRWIDRDSPAWSAVSYEEMMFKFWVPVSRWEQIGLNRRRRL